MGSKFKTNVGIPQGDCLSAILFTVYLARALAPNLPDHLIEHNYTKNFECKPIEQNTFDVDHSYAKVCRTSPINFILEQQYADISYISNNKKNIQGVLEKIHQDWQNKI